MMSTIHSNSGLLLKRKEFFGIQSYTHSSVKAILSPLGIRTQATHRFGLGISLLTLIVYINGYKD